MKKQAWNHVLMQKIFYYLEDNFPRIAHEFSYFSRPLKKISDIYTFRSAYEIKFFDQKYQKVVELISTVKNLSHIEKSDQKIIISHFIHKNFFIVSSNKSAIENGSNLVINYSDNQRMKWGNAFPLIYTKDVFIEGYLIYIPQIENYYHVVVDYVLPAVLYIIKNLDKVRKITFLTKNKLGILDVFCDLLRKKGVEAEIRLIKTFEKIRADALISGISVSPDEAISFAYKEIFDFFSSEIDDLVADIDPPDFVLVSRHKTKRRNLLNEPEVFDELKKHGFRKIVFNNQNIKTQIAVFRKSKIIISVHGAALTNIMWARKSKIIAISPKNMLNIHYLHLASQYNLDYSLLKGADNGSNDDFVIDKDVVINEVLNLSSD
jgi:hypothetical protein